MKNVSAQGSTIFAQGFSHALGNSGGDILVDLTGVDNYFSGFDGADYLEARAGDDTLLGGNGADLINGGSGDDILQGDEGDDGMSAANDNWVVVGRVA